MIDLALDPSETRAARGPGAPMARGLDLRVVLLALIGAGALGGFGVAASTLMAGLAAPPPVKAVAASRAADWPDLKDGLPALAGTAPPAPIKRAETEEPTLRMTARPDPVASPTAPVAARSAAAPEPPAKRIPTPIPVALIGPARQTATLPPMRMALLQPPRASETVRARDVAEPAAPPVSMPAIVQEKPPRKLVAARKAPAAGKAADKPAGTVAQSEAPEAEETEVLGIKLPSLAPAGRKLKEGVDALGEAVKNAF